MNTKGQTPTALDVPAGSAGTPICIIPVDRRPHLGWWAPGDYLNTCVQCGRSFIGDKRAGHCAPCAYGDNMPNTQDDTRHE